MKLSQYLAEANLTDAAFAELVGADRSTITRLRGDNQIPSQPLMVRIAEATNGLVTANDFFGITPPFTPPESAEGAPGNSTDRAAA